VVGADGVAAIVKIGGGLPGGIVSRETLPENLVLELRAATTMNVAVLKDGVDLPLWFVVDDDGRRWWLMTIRKLVRVGMMFLELGDVEDGMDPDVRWELQSVRHGGDDRGDGERADPSRRELTNLSGGSQREMRIGK
jgi:hypothetical protein